MTPHPLTPLPQPALVQGGETSPPPTETFTDVSHDEKGEALVVPPTTTTTPTTPLTTLSPTAPGGTPPTLLPTSNLLFESAKELTQPKAPVVAPKASTLPPTEVGSPFHHLLRPPSFTYHCSHPGPRSLWGANSDQEVRKSRRPP